jgi:hypothetical protein
VVAFARSDQKTKEFMGKTACFDASDTRRNFLQFMMIYYVLQSFPYHGKEFFAESGLLPNHAGVGAA